MRRFIVFLFFLICSVSTLMGQSYITGTITDEKAETKLSNATIMMVQAKDSILVDFVRANENGKFQLRQPSDGNYLLMISYPKFSDFNKEIRVSNENIDIGTVKLSSVAHVIEEVLITGRIPIVIKGDTTEYDAASFKTEKNAKVEDLLKVLPGITVDANGKITAQGKTVEKMLVDGEEFFSDDPVLVSRNIRSDMVDKIQVYEKKSDKTEKTGVDDGKRTQTINVKLKEEAKRGIFGKVEAGAGTNDFYLGQGFLNYFNQSFRSSAYFITSNNGKTGLSDEESSSTGIDSDNNDGSGNYGGEGMPKTVNMGFLYSDKSKNKKVSWRLDYKYNKSETDKISNGFSRNAARDTVLERISEGGSNDFGDKHNFGGKYEHEFDSLSTLTVWLGANQTGATSASQNKSSTVNNFGQKINDTESRFGSESKSTSFNINAIFNRKFSKKGRSLSLQFNTYGYDQNGEQSIYSNLKYYKNNIINNDSISDQRKNTLNTAMNTGGTVTYTEPLMKNLILSLEYGISNDRNHNVIESFNKNDLSELYDVRDDLYSNDFEYNTFKNSYNLSLNYNPNDRIFVNLSNYLEDNELSQVNKYDYQKLSRSFFVYNPLAEFRFEYAKNKSVGLSYSGANNLPSLSQIQPLRSNLDPLNEYLGNEGLKPAYTHNVGVNYRNSSLLKGRFYGIYANGSRTNNALIQNVDIDTLGKSIYIWDNLKEHNNSQLSIYGYYHSLLFKKLLIRHGATLSSSFGNTYNNVNGELANATYQMYSLRYNWQKSTSKGLDFDVSVGPGYIIQNNSIRQMENSEGLTFESTGYLSYFLPKKFILRTNFEYTYQAPTSVYAKEFQRFLVNPSLSKKFMKDETLEFTFMVNDLLNQNVGFRRDQNGTQLTERRYNTIGRYFMVKMAWEINKMFVKKD